MSLLLGAKYKIKILWAIPITSTDKVKVFPLVKMEEKINRVCSKRGRFKAERAQLPGIEKNAVGKSYKTLFGEKASEYVTHWMIFCCIVRRQAAGLGSVNETDSS